MKKIIGITGGVGSGKSTVLNFLEKEYHARILMADKIGHEAFEKYTDTYKKIAEHFGKEILDGKDEIDHVKLAAIIFNNKTEKEYVNNIIHPFVLDRIKHEIEKWNETITSNNIDIEAASKESKSTNKSTETDKPSNISEKKDKKQETINLLIIETALMFETGCDKLCDEVWSVTTDEDIRISRLMRDRGYSEEKAKAIIATQLPDEELIRKSDRSITNNQSVNELKKSIKSTIQSWTQKVTSQS